MGFGNEMFANALALIAKGQKPDIGLPFQGTGAQERML